MHLLIQKVEEVCAKRARRKEARPGELLSAALDLFVEKGFAATKAEEVAARAGVSKGTLFLYFKSKEDLFKAVVRENISGKFDAWNAEFDHFEGSTAEMLSYAMHTWWANVGATKASGITKLMMSEARNFPELAEFYQNEVTRPGNALLSRILQRGIARGEFRAININYGVYSIMAPLLYLVMWKHSWGACTGQNTENNALEPKDYIAAQIDTLLNGFCAPASATTATAAPLTPCLPPDNRNR